MNHIVRLKSDLSTARAAIAARDDAIQEFRVHLDSDKFRGPAEEGSRKDWISVSDVLRWLARISEAEADAEEAGRTT